MREEGCICALTIGRRDGEKDEAGEPGLAGTSFHRWIFGLPAMMITDTALGCALEAQDFPHQSDAGFRRFRKNARISSRAAIVGCPASSIR